MKKFVEMNRKGFTLIEVIVVAAIIAILAGILVPMIFNQIDESKKTRAQGDVKTIQQAVATVKSNTLRWPTWSVDSGSCAEDIGFLWNTASTQPDYSKTTAPTGSGISMYDVIGKEKGTPLALCYAKVDNPSVSAWAGPYLAQESGTDPWGKSYIIYLDKLKSTSAAPRWGWVISAGPDGYLDTDVTSSTVTTPANDDVGVRISE